MLPVLLPLLKNWKLFAMIGALVAIVSTIGFAYWHYTGLLDEVTELQVATKTLELEKEIQKGHIIEQAKALKKWQLAQIAMEKRIQEQARITKEAKQETRRLNALFAKHDFGRLAARKPGLIEKRINRGTANLFGVLGCETGRITDCQHSTTESTTESTRP